MGVLVSKAAFFTLTVDIHPSFKRLATFDSRHFQKTFAGKLSHLLHGFTRFNLYSLEVDHRLFRNRIICHFDIVKPREQLERCRLILVGVLISKAAFFTLTVDIHPGFKRLALFCRRNLEVTCGELGCLLHGLADLDFNTGKGYARFVRKSGVRYSDGISARFEPDCHRFFYIGR